VLALPTAGGGTRCRGSTQRRTPPRIAPAARRRSQLLAAGLLIAAPGPRARLSPAAMLCHVSPPGAPSPRGGRPRTRVPPGMVCVYACARGSGAMPLDPRDVCVQLDHPNPHPTAATTRPDSECTTSQHDTAC
jgi:hypothetical protein